MIGLFALAEGDFNHSYNPMINKKGKNITALVVFFMYFYFKTFICAPMKPIFNLILLLVILLAGCATEKKEVVISGHYSGQSREKIASTETVNGIVHRYFTSHAELCPEGNFSFTRTTERPAFVNFLFYGAPSLIVEPGSEYYVELFYDPSEGFEMDGEISDIQAFYNAFNHQDPRACIYEYPFDISDYQAVNKALLADLQEELEKIDSAYNAGILSQDIYELIKTDRQLYYQVARTVVASANYLRMMAGDRMVPEEVFEIWEDALSAVSTDNPWFFSSLSAYDYLLYTYWHHIYTDPDFDYDEFVQIRSEKREARQAIAHTLDRAPEIFSGASLEFFMAAYIADQYARRQPHDELPGIITDFATKYPDSDYLVFLERIREELEEGEDSM